MIVCPSISLIISGNLASVKDCSIESGLLLSCLMVKFFGLKDLNKMKSQQLLGEI